MSGITASRPAQIPTTLAAGIIFLVLCGAIYLAWHFIAQQTTSSNENVIVGVPGSAPAPTASGGAMRSGRGPGRAGRDPRDMRVARDMAAIRAPLPRDVPPGITKSIGGVIRARRGEAFLRADAREKGEYGLYLDYVQTVRQAWATSEQYQMSELAAEILTTRLADEIQLTADQRSKLLSLPSQHIALTAAERQRLQTLLATWDNAAAGGKDAAGESVLAAVAEIGTAHLPAAKAAMLERSKQIPQILTAQQLQRARKWNPRSAPPASAPPRSTAAPAPAK